MTYLLKRKEKRGNRFGKFSSLIIVALVIVGVFYLWGDALSPLTIKIFTPVSKAISSSGSNFGRAFNILIPKSSLVNENESLKDRVAKLEERLFDYNILITENEELRQMLELTTDEYIASSILLMPPQTPFDTLIIDRGEKSGVAVGAKVNNSEHGAVGYVEEVYADSAKVRMFSSPGIKTSAIFERDGTMVELEGRGGGSFIIEAPLGFEVVEGDLFVIPGSEDRVVAVVRSIEKEETSSFVTILLRLPIEVTGNSTLLIEV